MKKCMVLLLVCVMLLSLTACCLLPLPLQDRYMEGQWMTVPSQTVPDVIVPDQTLPEETVPQVPQETVPQETAPQEVVPQETVPEETETIYIGVTTTLTADYTSSRSGYLTFIEHSDEEYLTYIAFRADTDIYDLSFGSLSYDGPTFEMDYVMYESNRLPARKKFVVGVEFYGDMTTFGLSFTDDTGTRRHFAVYTSGMDGSLILYEYTP